MSKKKLKSIWGGITPSKSDSETKKIKDDLEKTGNWKVYYERMYEKTKNETYKKKLKELLIIETQLEHELKSDKGRINREEFEKALKDAMAKRIKDDLIHGNVYMEVSGKGDVEFIDGKDIVTKLEVDNVQLKKKKS